jgi:hypothetical protein
MGRRPPRPHGTQWHSRAGVSSLHPRKGHPDADGGDVKIPWSAATVWQLCSAYRTAQPRLRHTKRTPASAPLAAGLLTSRFADHRRNGDADGIPACQSRFFQH